MNNQHPELAAVQAQIVAMREAQAKAVEARQEINAAAINAVPLSGSDKQIAWANDIRAKQVGQLADLMTKLEGLLNTAPNEQVRANIARGLLIAQAHIDKATAVTAAKDWIDSRNVIYNTEWLIPLVKASQA